LTLALLGTFAPSILAGETVQLGAAERGRAGIVVRPVLERSFGESVRVIGEVVRTPGSTVTIKTPVHGRVEALMARPGDQVREGQPLLLVHSHELHALEGEVLQRRESMRIASSRADAARQLFEIEGISRIELEQREQEAMAARLAYDESIHELHDLGYSDAESNDLLERGLPRARLTLRSPLSGVVLDIGVQEHEWIESFVPLVVIGDPRRLELQVKIPPDLGARVRAGDVVDFAPVGRPGLAGRAKVSAQIPRVDPATRTMTVRAKILESPAGLVPGTFVEGSLVHGESRVALSVPESAVVRIGSTDFVFVERGPESFEARPVTLGRFNGTRYEITEGVSEGERVAVAGVFFLKSALLRAGDGG
jgi:cobalt-zinc-cadmium efflux system membrane fusion protein